MHVISGKEKLSVIYNSLTSFFSGNLLLNNGTEFHLNNHVDDDFFNILFTKPLIFYCSRGNLNSSYDQADFTSFSDVIFHAENLETLKIINTLSNDYMSRVEVSWIILEVPKSIVQSAMLDRLVFLDYWQLIKGKKNTAGKINYAKLESYIIDNTPKNFPSKIMKKFKKFITYPILGVKPLQYARYVKQELKYIKKPTDITINQDMYKNTYQYECCICGTKHAIVLSGSERKKTPSSTSMIKYDRKRNMIEFMCDHGNGFEDVCGPHFNIRKVGEFNLENANSYDQAFLFLFYRFAKVEDNLVYLNKNSEKIFITLEEYITK